MDHWNGSEAFGKWSGAGMGGIWIRVRGQLGQGESRIESGIEPGIENGIALNYLSLGL
jgi:hypothetical protein